MTTALPTYHLPEEYRQQGDLQGYGAPYEQLRNQDLAEIANKLMSENRGLNVANYPYDLPEDSVRPAAEEAANLPMFEGYGAPYEQLQNQNFMKPPKFPCLKCQRTIVSCRWPNKTSRIKATCNVMVTVPLGR